MRSPLVLELSDVCSKREKKLESRELQFDILYTHIISAEVSSRTCGHLCQATRRHISKDTNLLLPVFLPVST